MANATNADRAGDGGGWAAVLAIAIARREAREWRRAVRRAAGVGAHVPIVVRMGDAAPRAVGESWRYETRTGRRVYHPNAYARKGWSSLVYVHSTWCVVVGEGWRPSHSIRDREIEGSLG